MSPVTELMPGTGAVVMPRAFDVARIRDDFPILRQKIHGKPLVYLDNGATTQKPRAVLDAMQRYYTHDNANIHRAVHQLSERATRDYETAREKVRAFLNAASTQEIVFVRGATEGINLVAHSWGRAFLRPGDEVLVSTMEHHSNIVPWQLVCESTGAELRAIPINEDGELLLDEFERMLSPRTRLVSLVHLSNSLGTLNPVERVIEIAHSRGIKVLIDAAQSAAHFALDVQDMDADWLVFSGHKLYGPTGVGVLYGKADLLNQMPPWQGGGDMIKHVSFAKTTYADLPNKFEAGTPDIAGVVGLGAAIDYVTAVGIDQASTHEDTLLRQATDRLRTIRGVRIIGNATHKAAVLSFLVNDLSPLDVGTKLDLDGVAVRTGHHCCQPVMDRLDISGTVRMSLAMYNTAAEVDTFADAVERIVTEQTRRSRSLTVTQEESQTCPAEAVLCGSAHNTCPPKMGLSYAPAMGTSPDAVAEEVAEVFDLLDDWGERYQYLIELGEKLPEMPDELKTDCTRVHGCQSIVYLSARPRPGTTDVLEFLADSDAELVRGLIGLLEHLFSGQKAADILAFDVEGFFRRLGLDQHLSMNRRNGLQAMVQRLKQHAAGLAG